MPPHCDSLDGPVVTAARHALEAADVAIVLPYVHADGEARVREMFERVSAVRGRGGAAAELADQLFYETVVRVHRMGEGAPFTGLKPAGLDVGPVIPLAERAVESGDATAVADFICEVARAELERRLAEVVRLRSERDGSVEREREYVEAMLGFEVFSHHTFKALTAGSGHH